MQASGPSSPSPGNEEYARICNPVESFNETLRSLSTLPPGEAAVRLRMAVQDLRKQLFAWQREELEKQRTTMAAVSDITKKIAKGEVSSVLNLPIMFRHPIHGNARILDMLVNSYVGNPEVEVKVVGDARSTQIEEFGSQRELQTSVSEDKFFCSQASDHGIGMARNFPAISSDFCITEEARQGAGAGMSEALAQPHYVEEDQEQSAKDISGSASATTTSHLQTPNAMSKKQEWKNMQASGPSSSSSPGVLNSIESSNEAGGSSSPPCGEAAVPQIMAMQDMMNQIMNMLRELQKQMTMLVTVPITEEGERLGEEAEHKNKKIAQDEVSSLLNPRIIIKHPTHPITPSAILMAASPSESTSTVDSNSALLYGQLMELVGGKPELLERDARIQDVLVNSGVGNPEVEVKVVGKQDLPKLMNLAATGNSKMLVQKFYVVYY